MSKTELSRAVTSRRCPLRLGQLHSSGSPGHGFDAGNRPEYQIRRPGRSPPGWYRVLSTAAPSRTARTHRRSQSDHRGAGSPRPECCILPGTGVRPGMSPPTGDSCATPLPGGHCSALSCPVPRSAFRQRWIYTLKAPSDSNASPRATSRPAANQPLGCFSLGGGSFIAANSGEESLRATDSRRLSALRRRISAKPA